jgi:ribosomal-protein-alanine N-acetyltransferase
MATDPDAPRLLEGRRLLLRPITRDDAAGLHEAYGDPAAMRFWDFAASLDVAETAQRIGWSLQASPRFHACWAVVLRDDARVVGMLNYHHREPWNRRLEIGYILARAHWGRGLMSEALRVFLAHCFGALGSHRVEATIEPANLASIRLAEHLGFRREGGPMRDRLCVDGAYRSLVMYGLLEDEWRAAAARRAAVTPPA